MAGWWQGGCRPMLRPTPCPQFWYMSMWVNVFAPQWHGGGGGEIRDGLIKSVVLLKLPTPGSLTPPPPCHWWRWECLRWFLNLGVPAGLTRLSDGWFFCHILSYLPGGILRLIRKKLKNFWKNFQSFLLWGIWGCNWLGKLLYRVEHDLELS